MPLQALNPLKPLSDFGQTIASVATAAGSAIASGAQMATGQKSTPSITGFFASNILVILGLLLIVAGLFSFDKTRELVVSSGKAAGGLVSKAALAA